MRKIKLFVFGLLFIILFLLIPNLCMAKDLDIINEYNITVDPRSNGSLDIVYNIKWQVLDSDSEGPLEWVKIGIPNSSVDAIKALSKNIKSAKYYKDNGEFIRIDFKKSYLKDEEVEFSFSIHQDYMYKIEGDKCVYEFTPGWFEDIEVKKINILWNSRNVLTSSSKNTNSDNYLVWTSSLKKGKKLTAKITYLKNAFNIDYSKQVDNAPTSSTVQFMKNSNYYLKMIKIIVILIVIVYVASFFLGLGYYSHSGYGYRNDSYGHYHHYHHRNSSPPSWHSSSYHSSCVSSCACACACAGGGRAGCSKKDFYGTNLNTEKIINVLRKK